MKKTILATLLIIIFTVGGIFSVSAADSMIEADADVWTKTLTVQISPENISNLGNVKLPLSREKMENAGYFRETLSSSALQAD